MLSKGGPGGGRVETQVFFEDCRMQMLDGGRRVQDLIESLIQLSKHSHARIASFCYRYYCSVDIIITHTFVFTIKHQNFNSKGKRNIDFRVITFKRDIQIGRYTYTGVDICIQIESEIQTKERGKDIGLQTDRRAKKDPKQYQKSEERKTLLDERTK